MKNYNFSGFIWSPAKQYENNILLRPLLSYTGEHKQEYIPIEDRK